MQSQTGGWGGGGQRVPYRSGTKAPVARLSRQWPFGVAVICGGAIEDLFCCNLLLTKLVL